MDDLQAIVDSLGRYTERAVALQDRQGRMIAYSSHKGTVDQVRMTSILTRRGPARPRAWAMSFGIEQAQAPVRIPANLDLGMQPRVCAPVRFDGRLLGYLWLTDPDGDLSNEALRRVAEAAETVSLMLGTQDMRAERRRERELMRDLLSADSRSRSKAAAELIELGIVMPANRVVALVVRPVRQGQPMTEADARTRARLETALAGARDALPPKRAAHLLRTDHAVLLVSCDRERDRLAGQAASALSDAVRGVLGADRADSYWCIPVGVGDACPSLQEALVSYRQAERAARVAAADRSFGGIARWPDLGAYQLLAELPLEQIVMSSLHPAIGRLAGLAESGPWLRTLEVFLDLGGDARAAASALHVQRGSLYHRLRRIEELARVDLRSGSDRLALHLSIKTARLAGLWDGDC